jgi:hypothetical protein
VFVRYDDALRDLAGHPPLPPGLTLGGLDQALADVGIPDGVTVT